MMRNSDDPYDPYDPYDQPQPDHQSRDAQRSDDGADFSQDDNGDDFVWMSFEDTASASECQAEEIQSPPPDSDPQHPVEPWSPPAVVAESVARTASAGHDYFSNERRGTEDLSVYSGAYRTNDTVKKMSKKYSLLPMLALCLCFTLIGGALGGLTVMSLNASLGAETSPPQADGHSPSDSSASTPNGNGDTQPIIYQAGAVLTPAQIFDKCNQGVVAISTETAVRNIFGQTATRPAAGSGFVISSDGYIVTNNHVIEGASAIEVLMANGETYPAQLIGRDASNDLAVLKIEASGLTALTWSDSAALTVGSSIIAIGNPLGELANSATSGIVSALDRAVNIDGTPMTMMQIDASVSPGNSGGPLLNEQGEVVGVVSAKSSGSGVEGIGFAIPSNIAQGIVDQLIEYGYVTGRPYLGITPKGVDEAMSHYYNLPIGIYVVSVEPGSCAETAGLQTGDVIIAFDGVTVSTESELVGRKNTRSAGDTVEITIVRAGKEQKLMVTLDEMPQEENLPPQEDMFPPWAQQPQYGEDM